MITSLIIVEAQGSVEEAGTLLYMWAYKPLHRIYLQKVHMLLTVCIGKDLVIIQTTQRMKAYNQLIDYVCIFDTGFDELFVCTYLYQ